MSPPSIHTYLVLFIIAIYIPCIKSQSNITTPSPTTTSEAPITTFTTEFATPTISDTVVSVLVAASGGQLNLTNRYCDWNVSHIIKVINDTNPATLYSDQYKAILPTVLPISLQRQLPPDLIEFYELNFTGKSTEDPCDGGMIATTAPIDFCVGPLVHTDLLNPINEDADDRRVNITLSPGLTVTINASLSECGLACDSGAEVYGLSDEEQNLVDLFKILGCTLCFVAISFLVVNQYIDQRRSGKKFCDKPLLQIIPYLITLSLFLIVALMTLGEIIGKEAIVCIERDYDQELYPDEDKLEFSFFNPIEGKSAACTVHGILFYGVLLMYQLYTLMLSFIIFRQLYSPMRPLWGIRQRWWHIIIFSVIFILVTFSLVLSGYGGVYPMGVCIPGPSRKLQVLGFINIPLTFCTTFSFALLCASACLLRKELRKQAKVVNKDSSNKIQDLLRRLILYMIGAQTCLTLIAVTGFQFYTKQDTLADAMNESIECQLEIELLRMNGIESDLVCERPADAKMHPFYFISWPIAAILGVSAQLILSCHNEARSRLKRAATLNHVGSKLGNIMSKTGSKSGSNRHITVPGSPKSVSTSSKRRNRPHKGTITVTPQHKPNRERIHSDDEDTTTEINRTGTDIELMQRNTAHTATSQMEQLSLGESRMISMQSSGDDDLEITHTPITPDIDINGHEMP